ncbi:MAG: tRNA (N(6)-L-threonylcarbamoyladenosine(37)-C(2))-methylthiotransferase MtaB [Deltaproteobacteria bacterium]|nr:tRNA (N(6)-L-threonylcarbamoyladenosine(37)-C(2))-methylthiotransferase MtaB [Deltaproteobacteria bacterium]
MNVFFETIGCRLNEAEIQRWSRDFNDAGHHVVSRVEDAELVVLNTCAVTAEASRKSRKLTNRLHRRQPDAILVLTGCYAELEPEATTALRGVNLVVNNHDKDDLLRLIERELKIPPPLNLAHDGHAIPGKTTGRTRAFVKVQDGCRNRCTYCIVTIARGEERSRAIPDVVQEISGLVDRGYRETVLTGVHLGGYGSDQDVDLTTLVRAILEDTNVERLRLSSIEPWDVTPDLLSLWQDPISAAQHPDHGPRLGAHLHLPLQSGSDRILRRMARRYTAEDFSNTIASARREIPDVSISTDIIVGFPGETENDWAETLTFCERMGFAHIHIFTYSLREGTVAAGLGDHLSPEVKRKRSHELHRLAATSRDRHLARFVGTARPVLWEGQGRVTASGGLQFNGLTDNYLRCTVEVPASVSLENAITPVRLDAVALDGYHGTLSNEVLLSSEIRR